MLAEITWGPHQASTTATDVDRLLLYLVAVCGAVGLGVAVCLISFAVRYRRVEPPLREACGSLERASTLFGRAAKRTDAYALLAASRAVRRAEPLLFRARLQLELSRRR